jgi:hypothetical protein
MQETYWLAETDHEKVATQMLRRINAYAERLHVTGRADVMRRMSRLAFSRDLESGLDAHSVRVGGEQGELIGTRGNLLGRYVRAVHTLVTGTRPSYTARSIADSAEAISQVNTASSLLDFVVSKRGAEDAARRAQIFMALYGEGWLAATWDERVGRELGTDEMGRTRYEGDIRIVAKRPDEVVRDVDLDETSEHEWLIVARQVSRWKLMQQHPEQAEHIRTADTNTQLEDIRDQIKLDVVGARRKNGDLVTVYELFAPPSCVLPEGRYAMLLGDRLIADDRALYDDFAHYEMVADYEPGTKFGHSFLWDLCGLQQVSDAVLVAIVSAVENYGKPTLFVPEGSSLDTSKDAMMRPFRTVNGTLPPSLISLDANVLAPLLQSKADHVDTMTQISGLNDVALGDAGKSQSGEALATMHTLAQQSVSGAAASYAAAFGRMLFGVILRYRAFAQEERIIQITGESYAADVARFKASDIASIDGVDTEMVPAVMRHAAGRKEVADKLWASGALGGDPQRYLEVMATGRIEPILGGPGAQRKLIQAENERLREGKPVAVMLTDDDRLHIAEHAIALSDPEIRVPGPDGMPNPLAAAIMQHIAQHMQALAGKTQDVCETLGQVPLTSVVAAAQAQQQAQAAAMMAPPPTQAPGADPQAMGAEPAQEPAPSLDGATPGNTLEPNGEQVSDVSTTDMPMA